MSQNAWLIAVAATFVLYLKYQMALFQLNPDLSLMEPSEEELSWLVAVVKLDFLSSAALKQPTLPLQRGQKQLLTEGGLEQPSQKSDWLQVHQPYQGPERLVVVLVSAGLMV
jgi:hypothetical protein